MCTVRIGEDMGPINWDHPIAADMPQAWRDAEQRPDDFLFNGRGIIKLCMYDGWPYWTPRPAIYFWGPIGAEWNFFDSYGVYPRSIEPRLARLCEAVR